MKTQWRIFCLFTIVALFAAAAEAQDKKREAQLRTVRGVVMDKSESPVSGSVVFLKNTRTNSVRSNYTDDTGVIASAGSTPMQIMKCTQKKTAPSLRRAPFRVLTAARKSI